jgi:hypothetical protein
MTDNTQTSVSNLKEIAMAAKAEKAKGEQDANVKTVDDHALRKEQEKLMLQSFAEHLVSLVNEKCPAAANKGYGYIKLAEFFLPVYDKYYDADDWTYVPRHPDAQTHWWLDREAGIRLPIVKLLQGVREHTPHGHRLRPDLLAGGKTSVQLAQEILTASQPNTRLDCSFYAKKKCLIVTAIWIEDDWSAFLARRQNRPRNFFNASFKS